MTEESGQAILQIIGEINELNEQLDLKENLRRERDLWKRLWELRDCPCKERDTIWQELQDYE